MRNRKGVTIAALIIAIIGLSIGFAAFSNTLTIRSGASVNPSSENFVVKFSKVANDDQTGSSYPITPIIAQGSSATGLSGLIDSNNPLTLTGLSAGFTEPGQSVSYKLYIRNTGSYTAYLTNINFKNIVGKQVAKDYSGDATEALMQAALADISVSVTLGGTDGVGGTTYTQDNNSISNTSLEPGNSMEVYVTINYANSGHYVDGSMHVEFGDIMIQYRSVDSPLPIPDPEAVEPTLVIPDYVVTPQGEITAYYGSETSISIPSSLPLYTQSNKETVIVPMCVDMAVKYASYTPEDALPACEDVKTQVESGDTSSPFYSSLKDGGGIVYGYYATGSSVTVTSIGEEAFRRKNLTSVTIPNTVETIKKDAFGQNLLTNLNIPNSVTTIEANAFDYNQLTTLRIGSGITSIENEAFANSTTTSSGTTYGPNALTSVIIDAHENAVTLGKDAFRGFSGTICWLQDDSTCGE